jgi:hypothetical protein
MTTHADGKGLPAALHDLRESVVEPDWNGMEQRLVEAFESTKAPSGGSKASEAIGKATQGRAGVALWQWTAAAAIVVLAAAITFYVPSTRPGTMGSSPAQPPAPPKPSGAATGAPRGVTLPPPVPPTRPGPGKRATRGVASAREPAATIFDDFVALPGAFALPDFESGRIVRVEVPLTVLPAFGIDLVPDAAPAAVQADFLIGQDGVPRAIRLASHSQRQ